MSCPTGVLIDFTNSEQPNDDNTTQNVPVTESTNSNEVNTTLTSVVLSSESGNKKSKLCGYLTKISTTGLMKTMKSRWFIYAPETCELAYYRSSDSDIANNTSLGRIPLRQASFSVTAPELQDNIFTITAENVTHKLQASDRKALLWWLQELQSHRRVFNTNHSFDTDDKTEWHGTLLGSSVFWVPNTTDTCKGLLTVGPAEKRQTDDGGLNLNILPHIDQPPDTLVGMAASPKRQPSLNVLSNSSLANLSARMPSFNAAISNASEVAMKGLRSSASRLRAPTFSVRGSDKVDLGFKNSLSGSLTDIRQGMNSSENKTPDIQTQVESLQNKNVLLNEELELLKNNLQTKEETVQVLKLALQEKESNPNPNMGGTSTSNLRSELIAIRMKNELLQQNLNESKEKENELAEQICMLHEMITAKDQVLVQLSNEVYELESSYKSLLNENSALKENKSEEFVMVAPVAEDVDLLKDTLEGYTVQNKFLNMEILELANLRQLDTRKIKMLRDKCSHQEAEYCQLHSKYLVLLSEMNKPRTESLGLTVSGTKIAGSSDADRKEMMMKILISEALDDAAENSTKEDQKESKWDEFGFSRSLEDETETSLLSTASRLQKRSSDILYSLSQHKASIAIKWQNYLSINKELQGNQELKMLIRMGIPHELRPQVWSWMVERRISQLRQRLDSGGSYYSQLVESKEAQLPSKQIELDLLRTLPNNRHFASMACPGVEQLRRVLRAYSVHNPSIGYCQGLNRVAAVALLYLCEEDAFWCLVAVVEQIMPPDYYSMTLTASQADQRVFRDLLAEKLPRLHRHFEAANVDTSLITFNWFLCIYCDNIPAETMLHVWDVLLYEGSKVLFRFGLAFFKSVEEEILQLNDYIAIFNFLRVMSHRMHDVRSLTQIAFQTLNHFPMRKIHRLRALHLEKVNAELRELENLRRGFVSVRKNVQDADADSDEDS
ncbi:TBC1 domain family member 2B-like [Ciona intestinalis]